ncbi:MAG: type VII secretion integral membrane protein EccD, partial [Nocardioides sp.]
RAQFETEAAVTVAWTAGGYAAAAGLMLAPDDEPFGLTLACAGGGLALVGVVCLIGLGAGRTLLIPAAVAGTILGVAGVLVHTTAVDAEVLLTVVATFVVLVGSVFPWLALGATGTTVDQLYTPADITADPDDIDLRRVSTDAHLAHEILIAISATVGLLLVLVAPLAVSLGLAGTLLACVACLVVMLRTRQYRTGSEVLVGLVSGILGLVAVAISVLVTWEEWRPTLAVVLAVAGAVVLAATLLPSAPSVRRGRFGDVLETVVLISLLPLLVVASGLFDAITN